MSIVEINQRYSALATTECCLSCGGAINYAKAQNGEVCVDLGSGRGTDAIRMAEAVGENGFVYGVDISEGMLEKANQTAQKLGVKNVRFLKCELENITIPDATVNLVISNCTINHASDKLKVWKGIFRILKNDGRFAISDIYSTAPVPEEYRNNAEAIAECWAGSVTRDEYLKTLKDAGFSNIEILEESAPYAKGKVMVASWTIAGKKQNITRSCCK